MLYSRGVERWERQVRTSGRGWVELIQWIFARVLWRRWRRTLSSAGGGSFRRQRQHGDRERRRVACRRQLPKQAEVLTRVSPNPLRLGRIVPVLPVGPARAFEALGSA